MGEYDFMSKIPAQIYRMSRSAGAMPGSITAFLWEPLLIA
jgi:hypothetical protein